MSDNEHKPEESIDVVDAEVKPKRQMSEKQLANLAKAREKAKVTLSEKKKRTTTLKQQERRLKELKMKEKEDRIQAELNALTVNVEGDVEDEPVKYVRKSKKKKKPPKVVYYSSSSEDDAEPEIVYKKKPKAKPPRPLPTMAQNDKAVEDAAIDKKYNDELIRMRREYMMKQVFPY
jgi:hypothetical protein